MSAATTNTVIRTTIKRPVQLERPGLCVPDAVLLLRCSVSEFILHGLGWKQAAFRENRHQLNGNESCFATPKAPTDRRAACSPPQTSWGVKGWRQRASGLRNYARSSPHLHTANQITTVPLHHPMGPPTFPQLHYSAAACSGWCSLGR